MDKIIIFGKNGQIGSNLTKYLHKNWHKNGHKNGQITAYGSDEVNFADIDEFNKFLNNLKPIPNFIINAAAYTAVDKCEEERELADKINHQAVAIIADFCAQNNIKLIHYSTDYVFDGSGNEPFTEDNIDHLKPLNFYGKTKLDGEKAIINSGCDYIILRTSWVYNDDGKNFVNTITKLAQEKEVINIISDQIGSPTYAKDIAVYTTQIINKMIMENFHQGVYHLTNSGYCSWYDFATKIVVLLKEKQIKLKVKKINNIKTSNYQTLATRPLNSRLNCDKISKVFGIKTRSWQEALEKLKVKS